MKTALSRLRVIGNIEGISYLLLLGVAMPLKYLGNMPMAVKIAGSIHGFLFVSFIVALENRKMVCHKTGICLYNVSCSVWDFLPG